MRSSRRTGALLLALGMVLGACSETPGTEESTSSTASTTSSVATSTSTTTPGEISASTLGLVDLGFTDFLQASFEHLILRDPQGLTSAGVAGQYGMSNDLLTDLSDAFIRETQSIETVILDTLRTYDREALSESDRLSYDVYEWYLDQQVAGHRFMYHEWPVHHFVNSYNFNLLLFLEEEHTIESVGDAEDYIARLTQIDTQVAQVIDGLRRREELGILPPTIIADWTARALANDVGGVPRPGSVNPTRLPLYTTFEERLGNISDLSEGDRQRLLDEALAALEESFVPAWIALYDHMKTLVETGSPEAGVWRLPDGEAFYDHLLRGQTSTMLTADEIHQIGLDQVERVELEMRATFDKLGYPSDVPLSELRDRARMEAGALSGSTARGVEEIVAYHERLIAEAEGVVRPMFGIWPKADVAVVPDAGGGGFYVAGSADGSRPGLFHAGAGGKVPLMTLPTVNYHEAVPGHHTQIAIAQELDLPAFRRFIRYNGYVEGWALYAERLADEAGLYQDDPLGNIGRLELELLRAVRLVVDTGIHSKRWSRGEAHAYMEEVIPSWTHEVERYMVLPGQATGYLIGQQEILRLRELAQDRLGDRFDIAAFHDVILGAGSLPLSILDDVVTEYASTP